MSQAPFGIISNYFLILIFIYSNIHIYCLAEILDSYQITPMIFFFSLSVKTSDSNNVFATTCETLSKRFDFPSNGDGSLTTEMLYDVMKNKRPYSIIDSEINSNNKAVIERKLHFCKEVEQFYSKEGGTVPELLLQNLKIYINLAGIKARGIIIEMMNMIKPICSDTVLFKETMNTPLVWEILTRMTRILECEPNRERIIFEMDNNVLLESNLKLDEEGTDFSIKLNENTILHAKGGPWPHQVYCDFAYSVDSHCEKKLLDVFRLFIDKNNIKCDSNIPNIRYILDFLTSFRSHGVYIPDLIKIRSYQNFYEILCK